MDFAHMGNVRLIKQDKNIPCDLEPQETLLETMILVKTYTSGTVRSLSLRPSWNPNAQCDADLQLSS